ncbi:MAG: hypothetical protein QF486_03800 [Candidatus Woesearchaeota archaeon]|jgi:Fe2+ or Zn2+ uptake regulation protein|nr:hypothetical protein [Candidatus Woesearchaeota archaeon]MDP7181631.1 hypothetical protein [Candidatus Woesearchaeota archaeon]MDP7198720.1 hypothetical protein [Candidatus Woesearchaeota archaeon]MDP7467280.1 hypothetical protein [Candidatus Woesearchaeota archaeon]MDP7647385.1 hypothetical protein [Candidatus Woesearchaeota archaeon]
MGRGRPPGSIVRERIVAILTNVKKAYGYQIHKLYLEKFPPTTLENVYYHLRQGVKIGLFKVVSVKTEKGRYSWGDKVEKRYYSLGKT